MTGKARLLAAVAAGVAGLAGCHHDKHKVTSPVVEEYVLPPNEARFNEPPTETYRKPPPKKEDKSVLGGGPMGGPGPLNPGGF
jgi:hypothetical protein